MRYLRLKWNYMLKRSTWWSGFYKGMVHTIKNTLENPVGLVSLDQDQFSTLLIAIENVINFHPLTSINDESFKEIPIPYHKIYGRTTATLKEPLLQTKADNDTLRLNC